MKKLWKKSFLVHNNAVNDKWSPVEVGWEDLKRSISEELKSKNTTTDNPEDYFLKLLDSNNNEIEFQIESFVLGNIESNKLVFIAKVPRMSSKEYTLCGYLPENENKNEYFPAYFPCNQKREIKRAFNYVVENNWENFEKATKKLEEDIYRPVIYQFNDSGDFCLRNYWVKFRFHTKSACSSKGSSGYAGCSSYMVVENREANANPYVILNVFDYKDNEIKGMQVERIEIDLTGGSKVSKVKNSNYEIVGIINGPVRASLVIKIELNLNNRGKCKFYRYLHLYREKFYIKESIFVLDQGGSLLKFKLHLSSAHRFTPGFQTYRGQDPNTKKEIEDWFAFGDENISPKQITGEPQKSLVAYGFASNCGGKITQSKLTNCFWELQWTDYVHCIHKLLCPKNTDMYGQYYERPQFASNMGDEWYDAIFCNLWAEI